MCHGVRYEDKDLVKHVAAESLMGRSQEPLDWLLEEHSMLASLALSLKTVLPLYSDPLSK